MLARQLWRSHLRRRVRPRPHSHGRRFRAKLRAVLNGGSDFIPRVHLTVKCDNCPWKIPGLKCRRGGGGVQNDRGRENLCRRMTFTFRTEKACLRHKSRQNIFLKSLPQSAFLAASSASDTFVIRTKEALFWMGQR